MHSCIYEQFHSNKSLFKPFVSWPDRVHLGLNNVDSISNNLLGKVRLKKDEHVLWICLHKASFSFKSNDEDSLTSDGCIITDRRICYYNLSKSKESFSVEWNDVAKILHMMNSFYIQTSLEENTYDLKISDYAMLGKKVDNDSSIVVFFQKIAESTSKGKKNSKLDEKSKESLLRELENNLDASFRGNSSNVRKKTDKEYRRFDDANVKRNSREETSLTKDAKHARRSFL